MQKTQWCRRSRTNGIGCAGNPNQRRPRTRPARSQGNTTAIDASRGYQQGSAVSGFGRYLFELLRMSGVRSPKAQVHYVHFVFDTPLESPDPIGGGCPQRGIKNPHGEKMRIGDLFLDRSHHRRPVSNQICVVDGGELTVIAD
jgi:hypothetical protein